MNVEPWNEERVTRMIYDGVEEDLHLDYKGAGSLAKSQPKREEIVKDVTAFANSDGGVIVYGVREHSSREEKHLPERLDPIIRSEFSKEWLEHVIANAAPRIPDVRIHPISVSSDVAKCLYVVEIPKGETAHQATDLRYYRRYNFESVAMRDHEIRDVMNRAKLPIIEVEAFLGIRQPWEENSFRLKLQNIGSRIAKRFSCRVRIPPRLDGVLATPKSDSVHFDEDESGDYYQVTLGQDLQRTPLFPKSYIILKQTMRFDVQQIQHKSGRDLKPRPTIEVVVFADEMEPIHLEFDPKQIRGAWGGPLQNVTQFDHHPVP